MAYLIHSNPLNLHGSWIKSFPLVLWENDNVHWTALNFLLDHYTGNNLESIKLYAQHLQDFFSQLECEPRYKDAQDIDDSFLKAFKQSIILRNEQQNTKSYAIQILRSVLKYCCWLQDSGYASNLVGETKLHRIRIKVSESGKIQHRLTVESRSKSQSARAPRTSWIELLKKYGFKTFSTQERFSLMLDWGRTLGLRAHEVVNLKVSDLPSLKSAEKAIESGNLLYISLKVEKGSKESTLKVSPLLIKETWIYINSTREEVIKKVKKANNKAIARAKKNQKQPPALYDDLGYLFLSEQSGLSLTKNTFSNQVRKAFLEACEAGELTEMERVWAHGLRHNFVTTMLKKHDEEGIPNPEVITRQASRHGSEGAMETYTTERYNPNFE